MIERLILFRERWESRNSELGSINENSVSCNKLGCPIPFHLM